MKTDRKRVLGVDIGGVLIDRVNDNTDTSFFGPNFLDSTAVEEAFASLKLLVQAGFEIHLVSKCGENIERKTRLWLAHHSFFAITGVPESNIYFCRKRSDKAAICYDIDAKYFVDDRLEVLSYLESVPNLYLLNADRREVEKFSQFLPSVHQISSWKELVARLCVDLEKTMPLSKCTAVEPRQ